MELSAQSNYNCQQDVHPKVAGGISMPSMGHLYGWSLVFRAISQNNEKSNTERELLELIPRLHFCACEFDIDTF